MFPVGVFALETTATKGTSFRLQRLTNQSSQADEEAHSASHQTAEQKRSRMRPPPHPTGLYRTPNHQIAFILKDIFQTRWNGSLKSSHFL